jgi:hypothetical protein
VYLSPFFFPWFSCLSSWNWFLQSRLVFKRFFSKDLGYSGYCAGALEWRCIGAIFPHFISSMQVVGGVGVGDGIAHCCREMRHGYPGS